MLTRSKKFLVEWAFVTAASRSHNMYTHIVACVGTGVHKPIVGSETDSVVLPCDLLPLRGSCDVMNHKFPEVLYTCVLTHDVQWTVMYGFSHSNVPNFSLPVV